ncbi:hypothetical protein BGW36DRAFT_400817 [Talaromyces proteolyticus]|uniref:DUF1996 domain-containing protein n=1 Tax=Talaromyces proteolyticus TaxID=1131652 RepID=A0AAD4PW64_9EURO|nr:uncharacterized protein BGW36DRAFT_400817 [Talaromyces proteolyticus]KAH8691567.1 hypothetical protein BGW36DRAFT_400817 [Talaromyces proteolyticus]
MHSFSPRHSCEFTLSCDVLTIQRGDPVISPGVISNHTHVVVGGTAFNRSMSQDAAPNALGTTCSVAIDRSNYWQPLLYHIRSDGGFEAVNFQGNAVYYLQRACDYAENRTSCPSGFMPKAPPSGLRMISGNPSIRNYTDTFAQRAQSHMCLTSSNSVYTNSLPTQACLRLRSQVFFPSCWDGVNLDIPNHTHVSFPAIGDYNTGVCPSTHPVAIFSVFLEFFYDTSPYPDWQNLVYANGDITGYGLHGDFVNGWTDINALQKAFDTCGSNGYSLASPGCSITNGTVQGAKTQQVQIQPPYENLGLNGSVSPLPGPNFVTGSVADRTV